MTLIESEQSKDTQLTQIARGPFILRYASYRKGEDAKLDLRSEDYIVSKLAPGQAIFGLCDGVGSSFYGNIGSQFLGETILNWLGNVSNPNNSDFVGDDNVKLYLEKLNTDLKNELNSKIKLATNIIQNRKSTSHSELIRLAEKTQRLDFGTQSNFVGGIIWPKSTDLPDGRVLLFWLGNARVRIFNKLENNKFEELTHLTKWGDNPEQLKEVWSSREGVVGHVYSFMTDLSKITTVIAYSDGLEGVEEKITPNLQGVNLEALIHQAQSIKDDDVSYLEIFLSEESLNEYTDDIVATIRRQYNTSSSIVVPESQFEFQELEKKYENLEKKMKNQSLDFNKSRKQFRLITAIFVMSAISLGLLLGFILGRSTVVKGSPIQSSPSTFTQIPASITPIKDPSLMPSPHLDQVLDNPTEAINTATQETSINHDLSLTSMPSTSTPSTPTPSTSTPSTPTLGAIPP